MASEGLRALVSNTHYGIFQTANQAKPCFKPIVVCCCLSPTLSSLFPPSLTPFSFCPVLLAFLEQSASFSQCTWISGPFVLHTESESAMSGN